MLWGGWGKCLEGRGGDWSEDERRGDREGEGLKGRRIYREYESEGKGRRGVLWRLESLELQLDMEMDIYTLEFVSIWDGRMNV